MKKVFFYLLASMFAAIMFITSCNPNNQDDETNTDGDESVEEEEIVNPDYLSIDWENATVLSSNDSIGEYQITFSGDMPDIIPGSVLTIDQDTIVRYVFVESVEMDGNIANIRTSAAYLTDIFSNTTITLASDNNQRGNNVFLPTEIFYFDDNGEKYEIDLNANRDDNFGFTHDVWNFSDNLDGTELLSGENYKIYMEKLSYNFDLDFVMEMNFGGRNIVEIMSNGLERYKSKAMNIETSLVGNFDTEQTLRYDVEGEGQYSPGYDLWKHNFFRPVTIKFSVYGVPVVINLRADLFREVELSTEGEISAYVGFSEHANGKLGFNWAQSGTMTPINSFSNTFTFVPPTVEGRGSIEAKAWAFPRISMMLYGVIGPSFDFKPYLSTTLNGGFKEEMLGSNNDFCAWSFDCNTGLDAACGLSLGFMGYETENYSTDDFNIIDKTLYHSPERIELVPMQQKMRAGEGKGKDVEFNVYDRNYLADAEVLTSLPQFVKFEGDGEFSEKYGIAKSGVVSVKWTPSSEEDVMYARLYDIEGGIISEAEFTIETKVTTSAVTNITTESATCGGIVNCYYDEDIYERGVCYSTSPNPDVNDQCATTGEGAGSFTCNMTGLEDNTTYYVKAYAKMYDYVVYGEQKSFTTEKYETIVNTSSVTDITTNSAICGGNIMSDEAENIVERGICWSTSSQPDINDFCAASGEGAGSFTCNMTGLEDNTTYYVKAYAKMYDYVVYGEQKSFTTEKYETIVNTSSVTDITTNSAICGGNIMSDEAENIVERGICWSTSSQPDINDFCAASGAGAGSFSCNMTGLEDNTTYYVKAYAKLKDEIVYGSQKSFKTEEGFCDPDGEIAGHGYVDLGLPSGKKWATCNVGATTPEGYGNYYAWGETSPKAEYTWENYQHWVDADGDGSWDSGEPTINSDISGSAQYDAATANWGGGWRMPTRDEMEELVNNCEWEWTKVNGVNGARMVGPNGHCIFLPAAGFRYESSLGNGGYNGYYWSSTPYVSNYDYDVRAYDLYFYYGHEGVNWSYYGRSLGLTVRPITE